eukprot:426489-Karenia_brevis.AAC.1
MAVLNGDWSKRAISFYTAGRDITKEQARRLIYSAVPEMDLLHASTEEPSVDDWFSTSECAGKVSLGVLCHDILDQIIGSAFPNWDTMAQERTAAGVDDPA